MPNFQNFCVNYSQNGWFKEFTASFLSSNVKSIKLLLTFILYFFKQKESNVNEN